MAKGKVNVFFCQECGYESSKWAGQCPACKAWNSFVEERVDKKSSKTIKEIKDVKTYKISEIEDEKEVRISTGISEFDRVLGGGIVKGSLVLVGGDPGIGKSTLLLQMCHKLSTTENTILYVSGEESLAQIKLRANRIGKFGDKLSLLSETNLTLIKGVLEKAKPDIVIIDSIQTMYNEDVSSAPGSVSQVRETTNVLMQIAKGLGITIFVVGHVTKEGTVAGPRVLEHMVDTVLYIEGDRFASYRVLRGVKNRFGSTNEIGVFEMHQNGLKEVLNPSEYMLSGKAKNSSGSVVLCVVEGTRPMLLEIQALVTRSNFGMPRRTSVGVDYNRVNLLMAVLEKRLGLPLGEYDAYVNITGGIRISEPSIDLGIVIALESSFRNVAIDDKLICFGEVGLSGEVRSVSMVDKRVLEAKKLGFEKCIIPEVSLKEVKDIEGIEIIGVKNLSELSKTLYK
ncbi:MAG: DNA repair protein RadA [Lachnospiraceae bacterium]|nr:DNA repair protein RadA [Lachnospiraceae bacterium]